MLAQQTVLTDLRYGEAILNYDQWDGYAPARDRLLAQAAAADRVVVLTGDIHLAGVGVLPGVGVEFVTSSISSTGLIDPALQPILDTFDAVVASELAHRGYTRHTVTPSTWTAEYRIVDDVVDPASAVSTWSSFGVDAAARDSRPGMKPSGTGETVSMREIEQKFEVADDFELPSFDTVRGVAKVSAPVEHDLDATYYDTADLRLAASNLVLRRRAGGDDAGWHLKESVGDGERLETHAPLGAAATASRRSWPVSSARGLAGASLVPIAKLESRRIRPPARRRRTTTCWPRSPTTTSPARRSCGADPAVTTWREVEVELVDGDRDVLTAAAHRLDDAGAEPAPWGSKLGHALGRHRPAAPAPDRARSPLHGAGGGRRPSRRSGRSGSSPSTRTCGETTRTPCTRCGSPRDGCAARSPRSAGCSIVP